MLMKGPKGDVQETNIRVITLVEHEFTYLAIFPLDVQAEKSKNEQHISKIRFQISLISRHIYIERGREGDLEES